MGACVSKAGAPKPFKHRFTAMGSPCELELYAATGRDGKRAAQRIVADVQRLEHRYSRYRPDSFLAEINRVAAAGGAIEVDPETAALLDYADTCYRESDGLFDITSGILRRVWRFDQAALPDPQRIEALLDRIGWSKVRWRAPRLEFPPGMEVDLGGVVKEYAADRAAGLCREAGIRHGFANLGGDIRIVGPHPDGSPWRIGIRHPRNPEAAIATLALERGGVASSGDYERCIVVDGVRYGHVLNPKTGRPVRHLASVTVVGELCVVAGSASTIAMLREKDGPAWLERVGLPHFWVDVDGNCGGSLANEPDALARTG
jgi:thiamine biosynthesis lipoprotein